LPTARSAIKSAALAALPVLNGLGINAKRGYELAYWWSRKLQEGKLDNQHYSWLMTRPFHLEAEAYRGRRVLDVGCGPRGSLEWCAVAAERVGLDPLADSYRKLGVKRHAMRYCCAPAEAIPFPDEHFDVVTCINALDHVDDVERATSEICRVLAPGGLLLLIVEIHPRPTIAEPHALPWSLTSWFPLAVMEERHLERSDGTLRYLEHEIPFDHAAPPHAGMLVAKLMKPSSRWRSGESDPVRAHAELEQDIGTKHRPRDVV
jgi:ubiquinone/menaquinone biosynthesis C-methylase UbiE